MSYKQAQEKQLDLRKADELPEACQRPAVQMHQEIVCAMWLDGAGRTEFGAYFRSDEAIDYVNATVTKRT